MKKSLLWYGMLLILMVLFTGCKQYIKHYVIHVKSPTIDMTVHATVPEGCYVACDGCNISWWDGTSIHKIVVPLNAVATVEPE